MPRITTIRKTSGSRRAVERVIELHDRATPTAPPRTSLGVQRTADVSFVGGGAPSGVGTNPPGTSSSTKFEVYDEANPTPTLKAVEVMRSGHLVLFAEGANGEVEVIGTPRHFDPTNTGFAPF